MHFLKYAPSGTTAGLATSLGTLLLTLEGDVVTTEHLAAIRDAINKPLKKEDNGRERRLLMDGVDLVVEGDKLIAMDTRSTTPNPTILCAAGDTMSEALIKIDEELYQTEFLRQQFRLFSYVEL
jgi:hypothetical protein